VPRASIRGRANPQEFGHFGFQEDNFSTLGPKFSVKFRSLLEAFLNDFSIFQNGKQKVDHYQYKNPFPGGALILRTNSSGSPPPHTGANHLIECIISNLFTNNSRLNKRTNQSLELFLYWQKHFHIKKYC